MRGVKYFNEKLKELQRLSKLCRGDIIKMTTIAGSGHPAGSMSSIDLFLTLFSCTNISPDNFDDPSRDRIIISHGHTSPALYSCLARLGFIDLESVLIGFRSLRSPFEGHIERNIPGVEWSSGNLGQGLSAGCGFALAARLKKLKFNTFVVMSDAEQAKGQVSEARRFARKFNLNNLTVLIDNNHFQISGRTEEIMAVNIKDNYLADGWKALEVDGHDMQAIYRALKKALVDEDNPYVIIAETIMGCGVSFMENKADYHGKALSFEECKKALTEMGLEDDLDYLLKKKEVGKEIMVTKRKPIVQPKIKTGFPAIYNEVYHPRAVFGNLLKEVAQLNPDAPIAVFDCDLAASVKVIDFARTMPAHFFESGVSEHTTATIAGALSINGVLTIWADFAVFCIDEVYNQLRLNDINATNVKIVATHIGYNVGPDGKTHQCIDYIGLLKNLPGFKLIIAADPNHTDRIIRYTLKQPGNYVIALTRGKLPVIKDEADEIYYNEDYKFNYGKIDLIREGDDCVVFTMGPMVNEAVAVWSQLKEIGIGMRIYNVSSPLHIDREIILEALSTGCVLSYEDHFVKSGLGSIISQIIAESNSSAKFIKIGIREYGGSDNADVLYKAYGLDRNTLKKIIRNNVKK